MSAAKFKINKVSYMGRLLSLVLILPLWVLGAFSLLMLIIFENVENFTTWLFFETVDKVKKVFPFKGDDDGE